MQIILFIDSTLSNIIYRFFFFFCFLLFLFYTDTNSNDLLCDVKSDTITNVNNKIDETRTKLYVNNNNTKRSFINNLNKKKRSDKSGGFKNIVHKVMSWNSRTSNKDKPNAINVRHIRIQFINN